MLYEIRAEEEEKRSCGVVVYSGSCFVFFVLFRRYSVGCLNILHFSINKSSSFTLYIETPGQIGIILPPTATAFSFQVKISKETF